MIRGVRKLYPEVPILAYSADPHLEAKALEAGASVFCYKLDFVDDPVAALRALLSG